MASGLPDYYRGVDVAYQALSQMIVRPKYGGAEIVAGSLVVTASVGNTLCEVAGKGMTYGGRIRLDYTSTQKDSAVSMSIDGVVVFTMTFSDGNKYNVVQPRCSPMILQKFDDTGFIYSAGVSYGLTFETGIKLYYVESHGTTPTVEYNLIYALI